MPVLAWLRVRLCALSDSVDDIRRMAATACSAARIVRELPCSVTAGRWSCDVSVDPMSQTGSEVATAARAHKRMSISMVIVVTGIAVVLRCACAFERA